MSVEVLLLEDRTLLDVQLEVGPEWAGDAGLGAQIADALELVAETESVPVPCVVGVFEWNFPGHDAGTDHGGLEARALLVGEDGHGDRMPRLGLLVVERADRLERAEDAQLAVVPPARRHRIGVRAHHDRGQAVRSRARAEDIAHLIDRDGEPGLAHPADKQIAAAPIVVRQRHAGEPALGGGADLAQRVHALFEPLAIDAHGPSGGQRLSHGLSSWALAGTARRVLPARDSHCPAGATNRQGLALWRRRPMVD